MPDRPDITVRSAADVPWDDIRTVFGTRGDPAGCWCQYFKASVTDWKTATTDGCREALREQIASASPSPGVVAYLSGEPVGWCAVEPKIHYPRLRRSPIAGDGSSEKADDASVWAITCFVVRVGFRKRGIARALLDGAVQHGRRNGARLLEAYPIDTIARPKTSSAELYHGPLSLFESSGFTVSARPSPGRAVVTLNIGG
ncbi:N-acetyltransferase family protein [Leifsonia sp. A12D58]|uniref:GNAT family N-acetyltransferase n=1 Tax=Leifsonia sp. A12D58 TaxID=3397674 RepID=UPI0039E10C56